VAAERASAGREPRLGLLKRIIRLPGGADGGEGPAVGGEVVIAAGF